MASIGLEWEPHLLTLHVKAQTEEHSSSKAVERLSALLSVRKELHEAITEGQEGCDGRLR